MRFFRRVLIAAGAVLLGVLLSFAGGASAHPGAVDTSGGHYCTEAQAASQLCRPGRTYHRHDASGNIVVVSPGPEAAQLTGQQITASTAQQPFDPGSTPTTALATTPPAAPVQAAPAAADLARTGPISMGVAMLGALLAGLGLIALAAGQAIPHPVVLELDRRSCRPRRGPGALRRT